MVAKPTAREAKLERAIRKAQRLAHALIAMDTPHSWSMAECDTLAAIADTLDAVFVTPRHKAKNAPRPKPRG